MTGRRSKHEGELITSEWNARVRRWQWRVAIGGIGSDEGRENANRDETRQKGAAVARKHTQKKGEYGPICLPFGEASVGYLYESETAAIQCTLHRERGGKAKAKVERESLAGDRARGIVCEGVTLLDPIFLWTAPLLRHPHYPTIALTTLRLLPF